MRLANGLATGAAQLVAGEVVAASLPGARSPINGLGRASIDLVPGPLVDMTVATVASADKPLLRAALVAQVLGLGLWTGGGGRSARAGLAAHAALAGSAAASRPESRGAASLTAGVASAIAGAGAAAALRDDDGRRLRRVAATTAVGAVLTALVRARTRARLRRRRAGLRIPVASQPRPQLAEQGAGFPISGLTPLFTPNADFYVTDVSFPTPQVDHERWSLRVHGMVRTPLELTLADLLAGELVELDATLACVHNPIGGHRIGSARWTGVRLLDLLRRAGVQPGSEQVLARSVDGFSAGVPLDLIESGADALVVLAMNGEPLSPQHGFPARLLVPGLWGADANTKWLSDIELTTWTAARDYWDARGWPRAPSPVRPGGRIDVPGDRAVLAPGHATVAGIAWAPPDGVTGVEVSVDDGPWSPAELSAEIAPAMWRQWRFDWPAAAGSHELRARTTGRRATQSERRAPPYPAGSSGWHTVRVTVAAGGARALPGRVMSPAAAIAAALHRRIELATMAPPAWRRHGFPRTPSFQAPG